MDNIVIRPMTSDMILWRCLHNGPLTAASVERPPQGQGMDWALHRETNVPLLQKLIDTYGTCAMLAWDGDAVVGFVRFYPKVVAQMEEAGQLCLQQSWPNGPSAKLAEQPFPPKERLADKTLMVHCLMTGSPKNESNPYQRVGLGTALTKALLAWARAQGWDRIEATAYEDVDAVYRITGQAGREFWERLGFLATRVSKETEMTGDFLRLVEQQLRERGLDPRAAQNKYTMRRNLF